MKQKEKPTRQRVVPPSRFKSSVATTPSPPPLPQKPSYMELKDVGRGKLLNIIACGPSINEVNLFSLPGDLMCINKPILSLNPRWWVFFDDTQRKRNMDAWEKYRGTILNGYNIKANRHNQILIPQVYEEAFRTDGFVWLGKDSTYGACQIAAFMNYDRVFVWGLDKTKVGNLTHYYGFNEDAPDEYRIPRFDQECYAWDWGATHAPPDVRKKFQFMSPYCKRDFITKWYRDRQ